MENALCTILHIGQSNKKIEYFFEQTPIPTVTKQRDLRVTITSDLKWETHITLITKKANFMIYLIHMEQFRYGANRKSTKTHNHITSRT